MGNEASLEGGEGPLVGLPEGLAPDGKGGFVRMPGGVQADLSQLSEDDRKQLAAAVSRAQARQPTGAPARRPSESDAHQGPQQQAGVGASRGPSGLSKSRTVDAFGQGPVGKPAPGRSPSSLSLLESKFRQEPKEPETKAGMFGSNFLSNAVSMPKFGLFGDDDEEDSPPPTAAKQGGKTAGPPGQGKGPQQGPGAKGPQQGGPPKQGQAGPPGQGPKQGQGPPGQGPKSGQGPPGQQGPKPGQGPPGQGPRPGQGPPQQGGPPQQRGGPQGPGVRPGQQQQGAPKGGPPPGGPGKPLQQQGPPGSGAQPGGPAKAGGPPGPPGAGKAGGGVCPLCKSTQLNVGAKEPPNYSTCTECKNRVCSLCGFSPPDSAGKEWLCLNCQMQRAMGGMENSGPPSTMKPKQGSAPPSPQRKPSLLVKQQSIADAGPALSPPTTPRQKSPSLSSPGPASPVGSQPSSPQHRPTPGGGGGGAPKIDPKTGRPAQQPAQAQKGSPQPSPAKTKQESSFFGGLGGLSLGGLTDAAKPPTTASQAAESVTGKLFSGFGGFAESAKPQAPAAAAASKQEESVAGKLFGGFGGFTEAAKPQAAAASQGKMFGFGSSIFSSASNLVTSAPGGEDQEADSPPGSPPDTPGADSDPGSPPDSPFSPPGSPPDSGSDSLPDTPTAKSKPAAAWQEEAQEVTSVPEPPKEDGPPTPAPRGQENCPLCKVELNVGSSDTPNYSVCTECKTTACNLCGFDPAPHLGEKEWLCLNCQTHRALSGQLGETSPPPVASPAKKQPPAPIPTPPTSPAPAPAPASPAPASPVAAAAAAEGLTRTESEPSVTQAPPEVPAVESKRLVEAAAAAATQPLPDTKVVPEPTQTRTPDTVSVNADDPPDPSQHASPPSDSAPECKEPEQTESLEPAVPEAIQEALAPESASESTTEAPAVDQQEGGPEKAVEQQRSSDTAPEETVTFPPAESGPEQMATNKSLQAVPGLTEAVSEASESQDVVQSEVKVEESSPAPPAGNVKEESIPGNALEEAAKPIEAGAAPAPEAVTPEASAPPDQEPEPETPAAAVTEKVENSSPVSAAPVEAEAPPALKVADPQPDKEPDPEPQKEEEVAPAPAPVVEVEPVGPGKEKPVIAPEPQKAEEILPTPAPVAEETPAGAPASVPLEKTEPKKAGPTPETQVVESTIPSPPVDEKTVDKETEPTVQAENNPSDALVESERRASEKVAEKKAVNENEPLVQVKPKEVEPEPQSPKVETRETPVDTYREAEKIEHEPIAEAEAESVAHTEERQTLVDTKVEQEPPVINKSEKGMADLTPPAPVTNEEENVKPEKKAQAVEAISPLAAISEPQDSEKVAEGKPTQIDADSEAQKPKAIAEYEQGVCEGKQKVQTPTGNDEKGLQQEVLSKESESEQSPVSQSFQSVKEKEVAFPPVISEDCTNKGVENTPPEATQVSVDTSKNDSVPVDPVPKVEPTFPFPVASEQENNSNVQKDEKSSAETEKTADAQQVAKPKVDGEVKGKETLKEPGDEEIATKASSPTSPSDLAKLESTVLPILEAQTSTQPKDNSEKLTDSLKGKRRLEVLPISSESPSSEDDREISEKKDVATVGPKRKLLVPTDIGGDSLEDSGESLGKDSPISGEDEEFIRKQIMEMSENEDASPSDEENLIRRKIRDQEMKQREDKGDVKERSPSGKARRLLKRNTISLEDEEDMKIISSLDKPDETGTVEAYESKVDTLLEGEQEGGMGVRKFRTIELNTTSAPVHVPGMPGDDGELEMESLTDSPDDRSRGDGSSSLHASSFTPGTSPTSLSSLDEDSDSSPGHIRSSEGKQHRKAKHRQPGQVLPTIEDSSEEEELREEEELLREQEKQKGSGKKSKKDKEEIRAQRRRERPKTPPSNLSPIEDASPTEELRQEAEMEEIRRSSCSDFSPSIESEPEGFEVNAEKIAAVQKVYKLPTSVSLYSPTDDKDDKNTSEKLSLKSADEVYEEIMLKAKSPTVEKVEIPPGKESLYGGMLIEDYAYESLVDETKAQQQEPEKISVPAPLKKLRSPDEVYEDMMQKRKEFMQLEQEFKQAQPVSERPRPEIVLQPADSSTSTSATFSMGKDGKTLLDAEAAYEELMKKVLTPGTSPTQQAPDMASTNSAHPGSGEDISISTPRRALQPIPDLKVTQCSSGEEGSDEESIWAKSQDEPKADIPPDDDQRPSSPADPTAVVCEVPIALSSDQRQTIVAASEVDQRVEISQPKVMDLSNVKSSTASVAPNQFAPVGASVTPLPTVPQYTPTVPSIVSTAPPVPPKPAVLRRGLSQEKDDVPVPPPPPPPTLPKPTVYPRKPPVPLPPQASATPIMSPEPLAMTTGQAGAVKQPVVPMYKPHVPPPVPPKPSSIPAGIAYSHRPADNVKPPLAPKPVAGSQPTSPAHVSHPPRPTVLPTDSADIALNLSPSAERSGHASTPSSPRYASSLHDTYVVITLPSQPNSPVESITTHAPSSPGPASPSRQAQPQPQPQYQPTQTTRVPLAYTRISESMESQEICGPEKVVSSSCHVIEAISASAQPPLVMPNLVSQVVTTEVQRTTVSVVHERTPHPMPTPRANGVPLSLEKPKPQQTQTTQGYQPGEVVDLRTMKVDLESDMTGIDLSAGPESKRQSMVTDMNGRLTSAVQSPVVNLSAESSTVSIVTDSITIVTCAATIQRFENADMSQVYSSVPLQLTKIKAFEPVSQIIYRPIDSQPSTNTDAEIPINLSFGTSTGGGTFQLLPVTIAPTPTPGCVANGLTTGTATVAGAVDLSTMKPFNTVVSVDASSAEVVTAVIAEDDGKPVDLTAGRRAVCCDVVYNLPFAGSCTSQQPTTPLPEDRFGYRDDHYQYDRSPYGMRGFGGIKPSMSDTNLAEAGLFLYKSRNSYNFNSTTEGAVDLTSAKVSDAGEAVDYSKKGAYSGMTIPPYSQAGVTVAVGTIFGTSSVLRSSNGVVYSSVAAPVPSTYAITTQPGSIFSTSYNTLSGMHTSDTMPSLSNLQNQPLTRSHSFLSTISITSTEEHDNAPLNLETSKESISTTDAVTTAATSLSLDSYTDASLEAIAASLEALSSPMVPGDGQYQMEREMLEMEKIKQQRLAEELEWERQEIQRFREQEQMLVQKELEELQAMKQHILCQQEEERQAHLMMQKETYAQQQQQLDQIQRLQEQLRQQLEEQKFRKMYPGANLPGHGQQEAVVLGPDGTELARKIMDSGVQTDEEDGAVEKAYTAGRKKRTAKKSVDSCVQTDDEDQEEWEVPARGRRSRPRTSRGERGGQSDMSIQAHTEISIQTDAEGNVRMDTRMELSDSERTSPKRRPTPLDIGQSPHLKANSGTLQAPPKSPKVLYSPVSPCISPSKSLEFVSYDKSLGDTSPQRIRGSPEPTKVSPASPRTPKVMQRSMSDPKPMSPTGEERASSNLQYGDGYSGKGSSGSTTTGTQKKVKRTLPNPPSEDESSTAGQTGYSTGSARRRMCRNSNMARAKILQDIDRELDLVERESSKLRKKQAELDEEEKEIDAKLRYLEMGINRRKDVLLKEREKRERAYLQSVAEDRDYMSDSEVSNIRETRGGRGGGEGEEVGGHGLERPRTAPQSELDEFVPPQTEHEYGKYSHYQYPQSQTLYQQPSLYQTPQSYQSQSIYSSVPSLSSSQQQSYHQMLLLQQKAARQAALLSELDATKIASAYDVISRQPDPASSPYLGVKYDKYGNHLDLRALEVGSMVGSPMSTVSDSFYTDIDHHTPRSYVLLEDAAELAKSSTSLASSSYSLAEKELAKAERLLRRSAADLGSTDYLDSTSRLHAYGKTPDDEDLMEEPYELKLLKQQLKQEFRRSGGGTESLEQLTSLPQHYYTPGSGVSSYSQRHYPKTEKYSISRLTLEKQAAKQLPASMLYQKHKTPLMEPKISSKYTAIQDGRGLETDYSGYLGSGGGSPRSSRLLQDEITFGLRKNIAEQQKYLGSTLGTNLAGSLNLGQSLNLDSAYPSGSRSRPSSRPSSVYGLDLSIKRDPSSSSLRLKGDGEASAEGSSYQTPSGRTKPTSLPIVQGGRGRIPIVAQNSEEESPLSPVGQPMGMARASAGPLPPISADSRDQFGSCLSLQESQQQQHLREEPTRGRGYVLMDDLQGTMSDSEALSDSLMALNRDDPRSSHENMSNAYHLRQEETDWFDQPRDYRPENGHERRQGKGLYYPFPHTRVKLQRDPKDRSVSGNGLGIRVVGGKEVPGSNGDIGAYVAKVLPGGAAEQTGKILEGMQVLEWNGVPLTGKTYEEVQGLVGQQCGEAELCVRLDLNMLADSEGSQHLDFQDQTKGDRPPRSPGVDPKQLAAELQKVSQQQAPPLTGPGPASSSLSAPADKGPHGLSAATSVASSAIASPGQPSSPSVSKKRHSNKTADTVKTPAQPVSGDIQLQINYDKQLGNLIVHVLQARNLAPRDNNGFSDPFVKVYLLPGRGQVMVVQNASAENKRKSKHAGKSLNPEWNQTVIYKNIHLEQLRKKTLEVSVWDYDKCSSNDFLGEVLIDLSNTAQLDNVPRWLPLKEQVEGDHLRRSHTGQGRQHSPKPPSHSSPKTTGSAHDPPKSSVIKSRSHGIFPDPAKDTQVPTIEKSHSSPAGTSKPSPPESLGQSHSQQHTARSRGAARPAAGKSASRQQQHHREDGGGAGGSGLALATGEASGTQQQQQQRLQPTKRGRPYLRHHRHSVEGVLTVQKDPSDSLPAPPPPSGPLANGRRADGGRLTLRKALSEERPQTDGARAGHRSGDAPVTAASLDSGLSGSAYSLLDDEAETNAVDSAIFHVPRFGKIPNGTDVMKSSMGHGDSESKTQVMGEIKIALKKEVKTEGDQLVLEVLQCRNITFKFKSPDHLPDLYVKLYVVNIATQKRIIKKKTRVCRHDREPSFNETFRFCMNPTGHSLQLFLVSNGGKFMKKTLIGEAYVWLDKVDLRKRVVSWHKLLASTAQIHS